jgi:predicted PurR-regulated permease PerM
MNRLSSNSHAVDISMGTILKIVIVGLVLWFLFNVRDIIGIALVALIFSAAIDPWVDGLQRRGIPRSLSIVILFTLTVAFISLIVVLFVPLIIDQLRSLSQNFPAFYERLLSSVPTTEDQSLVGTVQQSLEGASRQLGTLTQSIFTGVASFFGGFISFIVILVLTFYMTLEEDGIKRFFTGLAPTHYHPYLTRLFLRLQERLGMWLRGQLLLGAIVASLTFIGLLILDVKYVLVLALIAGVTELIPAIGPIIGSVPAILVAFSDSPLKALLVLILFIIIQQLENHLIVPRVMSKVTGLNPIIIILVMLIGGKTAGIAGVFLAVPVTIVLQTFLDDFLTQRQAVDEKLEPEQPTQGQ